MAPGSTGHCFTGVEASSQAAQAPVMPSGSHKDSPVSLTFALLNGALSGGELRWERGCRASVLPLAPHLSTKEHSLFHLRTGLDQMLAFDTCFICFTLQFVDYSFLCVHMGKALQQEVLTVKSCNNCQ